MSSNLPPGTTQRHIDNYHDPHTEEYHEGYDTGYNDGITETVQQVTNIINDAKNDCIATSPIADVLHQLKNKIHREVE
jgi:flagellar biosynthesis/type III secretory pathway protein FliH